MSAVLRTPLYDEHVKLGARMVPFAGYDMPVQYKEGILAEHVHTRASAGLFDVSHMGQAFLIPEDGQFETAARALETMVPADITGLRQHQQRYTQLLNEEGGILDDLMVYSSETTGHEGWLYMVVNAACKDADYAHIEARLPRNVRLKKADSLALLALQGPKAVDVLVGYAPELKQLSFMQTAYAKINGIICHVSRSGYTGEDGVEISVQNQDAVNLWRLLLQDERVRPVGLGARDSLRLEAGLCLYGHDIDTTTSPVEAGLAWSIQKRRRLEGGFSGASRIQSELAQGTGRLRVGLLPEGRAPAREGTLIYHHDRQVGVVTSGGFGPSLNGPLAMGYVESAYAQPDTQLQLMVRGKALPAKVVPMPFVPHSYKR